MDFRGRAALVLLATVLSGCAGMSADECLVSDWYAVGYADGSAGAPSSKFSEYRKECAEHGVAADFETYRSGRSDGLLEYCQPERAFDLGSRGGRNPGFCPEDLRVGFNDAYQSGKRLFELKSALQEIDNRINQAQKRLITLQTEQEETEALLISSVPSIEERGQLLLDLKHIAAEKQQIEADLIGMDGERIIRQQRLLEYEASLY